LGLLGRMREEDHEFEVSLGYVEKPVSKNFFNPFFVFFIYLWYISFIVVKL
jgi:hypothetical protein